MLVFHFTLLGLTVYFCAKVHAKSCDVGVDGCTWTCKRTVPPDAVTCRAAIATHKSCEIGSSKSLCGTTCTCSKISKSIICKIGVDGCSWTCEKTSAKYGQMTIPKMPQYCVVGFNTTISGTTCECTQEEKCTVGINGCNWSCVSPPPGTVHCLGFPSLSSECYPGETTGMCGTTCTCVKEEKCTVGVKGCNWTCEKSTPDANGAVCMAYPATPTACYPGDTSSVCGTTCTCAKVEECTVGVNGCNWSCVSPPTDTVQCLGFPSSFLTVKQEKCTVGEKGCNWTCESTSPNSNGAVCMAYPATPTQCYPGETSSICGTTCTCSID